MEVDPGTGEHPGRNPQVGTLVERCRGEAGSNRAAARWESAGYSPVAGRVCCQLVVGEVLCCPNQNFSVGSFSCLVDICLIISYYYLHFFFLPNYL